jgi:hypothetical protein
VDAIVPSSLSQTVDAVNAAAFHHVSWPASTKKSVAHWIAGRQGLSGSYADTFAGCHSGTGCLKLGSQRGPVEHLAIARVERPMPD